MSAGEVIAIITAAGALITGVISVVVSALTSKAAARKDFVASLHTTIESLQHENQRMFLRIQEYENNLAGLKATIEDRDQRIRVLEGSLRDATQARYDREQRIQVMEEEIIVLRARIKTLENGQPK